MNKAQVEILMNLIQTDGGQPAKFLRRLYENQINDLNSLIENNWIVVIGPNEWYDINYEKVKELFSGVLEL